MTSIEILYKENSETKVRMADIPITGNSHAVGALMESDYIELAFVSPGPVFFEIGDYVDLADAKYDELGLFPSLRKKYVVKDKQVPVYVPSNDVYEYKLRLDAYYWQWNNRVFKYKPASFGQEASWSLTGNVSGFMDLFVDNLNAYGLGSYNYQIDEGANYNIYLSFDGTLMVDALNMIVSAIKDAFNVQVEWWVVGNTIHIGDCRIGSSPVTVTDEGDNKNAVSIKPKDADTDFANRIIVFGGTQNISARYRKQLWFVADQVNGNIISDSVRKQFSPSWFKTSEREYKAMESTEFSTKTIGQYVAEDYVDCYVFNRVSEVEHIIEKRTFGASTISIRYNVNYTYGLAAQRFEKDSEGHPTAEGTVQGMLYWNSAKAMLVADCEETGERLIVDQKEFNSTYKDNVLDLSRYLNFTGQWSAVNTDFVDKQWTFKVITTGTLRDPEETVQEYTAMYVLGYCSISYMSDFVYKVNTMIQTEDGQTATCEINPGYNDIYSDEARNIKVNGITIAQGQRFTFPNIVRGRVTAGYFTTAEGDTNVNSVVQRNLMLPETFSIKYGSKGDITVSTEAGSVVYNGKNYIDAKTGLLADNIVERIIVFDEIFPRMKDSAIDRVGSYTTETKEEKSSVQTIIDQEGEIVRKHIFYQFVDNDFPFTEDCLMENEKLKIHFQTGKLAGMSFEVAFNPNKDVFGDEPDRFEIVANEEYGIELPNDLAYPQVGDKYILTGWNVEAMEGQGNLISNAEEELLQEAVKLLGKMVHDPHAYEVDLMSDVMCDDDTTFDIGLGKSISLKNEYIFPIDVDNKRDLRIVGYDVKLDLPFDTPRITVGESNEYSVLKAIERSAGKTEQSMAVFAGGAGATTGTTGGFAPGVGTWEDIKDKPSTLGGFGIVDVYIRNGEIHIAGNSIKPLTEYDYETIGQMVYQSMSGKFLSKDKDDEANGHITFNKGITVKETANTEDIVNNGQITTKNLEVWGSAHFYEVVIDRAKNTAAIEFKSPANAKIDIVEQKGDVYRCYFLAKDADNRQVVQGFRAKDQILMQTCNLRVGSQQDARNRFFWALCTNVSEEPIAIDSREYHWIDIDMSVKASNSNALPQAEDDIVVLGHRGSYADRGNAILFASIDSAFLNLRRPDADKDGNHPLLKAPMDVQLQGINSFEISYSNPNNYGNILSNGYNRIAGYLYSSSSSQDDAVVKVEISHEDFYLCTATLEAPEASASGWAEAASPTEALPYIWKKTIKTYNDGTSQPFVEFVNRFQKGTDGEKGKDGTGITFEGERWTQELVDAKGGKLPKLYAVRMGDKFYVVINPEGTANPPVWCVTDWQGRRLRTSEGGYVLRRGDDGNVVENLEEWEPLAKFGIDGKDGYTPIKGVDYFDGAQGIGVKYISVYKRGNVSQMDKPNDASVTFDNPVPQGWSKGIPAGEEICWQSTRAFFTDGRADEWSNPEPITDTADFDRCFSKDDKQPPKPTTHGTQADSHWHNDPQEGDKWMATAVCKNGAWGEWQITQILGEEGKPAYLHTAYCNDITTWADFTVANPTGKAYNYVGTYTDDQVKDSTTPTKYKWVYVKGADATNANLRGEWKEGMTLNYMDVVRFEGISYLYKSKEAWSGYPRAKIIDYQGRIVRNWTGGLLWANNGQKALFATDDRWQVFAEDAVSLVVAKGFEVAKIKGKATDGVFTFASEQEALVELRRGNASVDDNMTYSIELNGCKGVSMQRVGSVCKVNIPVTATVDATKVEGYDYYLPVSDCSITVNCSYGGRIYSVVLPIQIDYSDRWSKFVQDNEQFKSELNGVKIEQDKLTQAQSLLKQEIDKDISGVHNELSNKMSFDDGTTLKNELKQDIEYLGKGTHETTQSLTQRLEGVEKAEQGLTQRMTTVEGNLAGMEQELSQKWDDDSGSKALNILKQIIETDTDGKIKKASNDLSSEIDGKYAKINTTVQKNADGTLKSKIKLESDTVEIQSDEFKLKDGNATFSGDVKIGDESNGHKAIELLKDGSGQIAKGNIEWKKNGDIILHIASENFVIDDAQLQQKFFAYLAEAFTFEIKDGQFVAIRANKDFYSVGSVSALGKSKTSDRDIFAELDALNARISALEKGGGDTPTPTPTPSEYGVVNTDNHIVVNDTYTSLKYVDETDTVISGVTNID